MKRPETTQETFLYQQQQYKRKIHFLRIFIFVLFLVLWELAADLSWINDFIFSSPKRLVTCFIQMLMEGTIWQHVSITLLETMISFVLVILFTILIAVLLWAKKIGLRCVGTIYGCAEQSAKICPCTTADRMVRWQL